MGLLAWMKLKAWYARLRWFICSGLVRRPPIAAADPPRGEVPASQRLDPWLDRLLTPPASILLMKSEQQWTSVVAKDGPGNQWISRRGPLAEVLLETRDALWPDAPISLVMPAHYAC